MTPTSSPAMAGDAARPASRRVGKARLAFGATVTLLTFACLLLGYAAGRYRGWPFWTLIFGIAIACGAAALGLCRLIVGGRRDRQEFGETERRLTADCNLLHALIDALPSAIFAKDTAGRFTVVNTAMARLLGTDDSARLLGRTEYGVLPTSLARRFQDEERAVLETGTPTINREEQIPDTDGRPHWFLNTRAPLCDKAGHIVGLVGACHDITDLQQTQDLLRLQSTALASSANGIIITDRDGRILWANDAFAEMTGYATQTVIGQTPRFLKSGRQNDAFYARMWQTIREARVWHGELINKRRDGDLYYEDMTITPVRDKAGDITHFIAIKQDVTERKQWQQQIVQAQKMESIGRLAGGIAHDFNNILQAILGFSDLLLAALPPGHANRPDVEEIRKASERAAALTRQLLTFSRKQIIQPRPLDLNELIRGMEGMLRRVIGENIELRTALDPALQPANADASQIEALITNLAVNGRDAMPNGGRLTISTTNVTIAKQDAIMMPEAAPGAFVCVAIADCGVGMERETIQHLFEPFYSTKGRGKGTGLGLATAYGIAKQHGGWINVYSQVGQGSTFKLYLPAASPDTAAPATAPSKPFLGQTRKGRGERILLIEDEQGVQHLATMVLRANGYLVTVASTAKEAIDIFDREDGQFDLVFSDVVLPDGNGLNLVERFLGRNPELRMLLTSGYSDQKSRWPAIQQRGWQFLQKPYPVANLLAAVAESLGA